MNYEVIYIFNLFFKKKKKKISFKVYNRIIKEIRRGKGEGGGREGDGGRGRGREGKGE